MTESKKPVKFTIREDWCKGCRICIEFCPKQVLILKNDKVYPEKPELCISCKLCELRCPDYAITVGGNEDDK